MCYNGFRSREFIVVSRVLQGFILGPLLFILFLDNLLKSLTCPVLASAKDVNLSLTLVKDLSVTCDAELIFMNHLTSICNASYKSLGFVIRTSKYFHDIVLLKALYFALVI